MTHEFTQARFRSRGPSKQTRQWPAFNSILDSVSAALHLLFYFVEQPGIHQRQPRSALKKSIPLWVHIPLPPPAFLCHYTDFPPIAQHVSHVLTCVAEVRCCPREPEKFGLTLCIWKSVASNLWAVYSDGITVSLLEFGQKLLPNQDSPYKGNFETYISICMVVSLAIMDGHTHN